MNAEFVDVMTPMFKKFDVSILTPGTSCDDVATYVEPPEIAAISLAKALAREGANVMVFCDTGDHALEREGVGFMPAEAWPAYTSATLHDVCIVQGRPAAFAQRTNARLNLLWCQDLPVRRQEQTLRGSLWNVDRIVVTSRYLLEQYKEAYQLDDEAFFQTRNGVDLELFRELANQRIERKGKKLITVAGPEEGLDLLLGDIMPRLLARDQDLRLYVARYDRAPDSNGIYDECELLAAKLGDRVVWLQGLTQRQLYSQLLSAIIYVHPTPSPLFPHFREGSCIRAMECQAAGLPLVTTASGALPEVVATGAGVLLQKDPSDAGIRPAYIDEFVDGVLGLITDDAAWHTASACALARANEFSWSLVAREWLAEFERLIRSGNDSTERLVRHFLRTSDVVAADHLLTKSDHDSNLSAAQRTALIEQLARHLSLPAPGDAHTEPERPNAVSKAELTAAPDDPQEVRLPLLAQWLAEEKDIVRLLDCGWLDDGHAIRLKQRVPHIQVHGIFMDRLSIANRAQWAAELGVLDVSVSVAALKPPEQLATLDANFDCVALHDVLERAAEPWALLEHAERSVRLGGKVYFTVPFGAWELTTRRSSPQGRLWHFDAHDLRDMVGSKPDLTIDAFHASNNAVMGEPQGFWIVSYTADHLRIAPVDLDRHMWLQRPRQSVSAAIIAGPNSEETLHWMFRSIKDLADEIIIADCGMNDEARCIAGQYGIRLINGTDPKREGFDRARNLALDAATCDWCLWIDTDERLVGIPALGKYLRENVYHAYGITQHNFACDATFPACTPVRLFRRRAYKGRRLRFIGAVHEHPELATNSGPGPTVILGDVHLAHVGYLVETARRARFTRNMPLLQIDQTRYPDRLLQKHFMMRDNIQLIRWALEQRGGQLDDEIRKKCRETIELHRQHFLGKSHPASRESLPLYSEALRVLGLGFDAAFRVDAGNGTAASNAPEKYRFASSEDFWCELRARTTGQAERLDSHRW